MDKASLCAHWDATAAQAISEHPISHQPLLAIHWQQCRENKVDQEALAREWGLSEVLDRRPPSAWPSFGVAIR